MFCSLIFVVIFFSQSDTRLLGLLGTPGAKGQKGDIVSILDEIWRNLKVPI